MNHDSSSRIAAHLRDWVAAATPGTQLPPTRELVATYKASPVTVQRALNTLSGEGLIESRPGVGTFVRAVRTVRPADYSWQTAALRSPTTRFSPLSAALRSTPNDVIALHAGYPDPELLPGRLLVAALKRATRSEAVLERPPVGGVPELQTWFAHELAAVTRTGFTAPAASDVVVCPGSQSGLSSIFRSLVTSGQPVVMESPTYWGAILAAQQAGVRIVPLPIGPFGPDPADLARVFDETGARVFYAQPNFANPSGAQWPIEAHEQVLDVVRAHGAFLVEDDWAHDFGITRRAIPVAASDDAGHVIYLRSLTKSVSPGLRVAAVIARGPAKERILADRGAESMYVSGLLQAATLDVVIHPGWRSHLKSVRDQLQARRDLLVAAMREHAQLADIGHVPAGGLNLWVRLPDGIDLGLLTQRCESQGLIIAPGTEWFPAEPTGPFVRLNYAGPNPAAFPTGARILGEALRAMAA